MSNDIDYSAVKSAPARLNDEDWEPPVHKFFGKKLENGKVEKEPVYSYQPYPKMMYASQDGRIVAQLVKSDAERAALGEGWEETPAAFGHITCPSWEQLQEKKVVVDDEKAALLARAKELNIPRVSANWGVEKLQEAIKEAEGK